MEPRSQQTEESSVAQDSVVASELSHNAAEMWQHYQTVQSLRLNFAVGENSVRAPNFPKQHTADTNMDNVDEVATMSPDREQPPSLEDSAKEISTALAAMVPLLQCNHSPESSLSSSCYITPASTPSRSPSPPPHHSSHRHHVTPSPRISPNPPLGDLSHRDNDLSEPTLNYAHHENHGDEPCDPDSADKPLVISDAETQPQVLEIKHSFSQTDSPAVAEASTGTEGPPDVADSGVQTEDGGEEGRRRREVGCNTELHIDPQLLERAQLTTQLAHMQSEYTTGMLERNEARSQQMVAEELARIVQSELVDMRQRNVAETTERVRLENQLGELKVELSSARKELDEKCQRVTELEDTLKGTSLLVRKLEEQNATSLMNRGGIDYMLQAKLADARAQEAEQKLEVTQVELLQYQGEVKRLLDRVGVATRDRSEMVSSKVHNQLLEIADERANSAEQRALQLERELLSLREQLGDTGHSLADKITTSPLSLSTYTHPSSYPTTLGAYPSLSSTLPPYTTSSHKYPPSLSSLPHSTPPSLEPFKLTFSLPSSSSSATSSSLAVSVPGSDGAAVPSGPSAHPATTTDEYTGLLKPSVVLGKTHVTSTDMVTSSPGQRDVTGSPHNMSSLELPSLPPDHTHPISSDVATRDEDSSSDWSTSDDDEDDVINPLRPSTHSTLQAQWEWRAVGETSSDKHTSPMATDHTPKKKPPPVAPKPRLSSTHSTDYISQEDPSSFIEPARVSGLNPLSTDSFRRPWGPQGRNLPSKFSNYNQ